MSCYQIWYFHHWNMSKLVMAFTALLIKGIDMWIIHHSDLNIRTLHSTLSYLLMGNELSERQRNLPGNEESNAVLKFYMLLCCLQPGQPISLSWLEQLPYLQMWSLFTCFFATIPTSTYLFKFHSQVLNDIGEFLCCCLRWSNFYQEIISKSVSHSVASTGFSPTNPITSLVFSLLITSSSFCIIH